MLRAGSGPGAKNDGVVPVAGGIWATGDFNYDGKVTGDDYALFNLGLAAQTGVLQVVPEPAAITFAGLALLALRRRRST